MTLFDVYPKYGTLPAPDETVDTYIRTGGTQVPYVGVIGQYVQTRFANRLDPYLRMSVSAQQATAPGLVAVSSPIGCDGPTGQEVPVAISFVTSVQTDSYNHRVPGGPGMVSDSLQTVQTSAGDTVVSYAVTDPANPPAAQFVSGLYPGDAIALDAYGQYPWVADDGTKYPSLGKADPHVLKPRVRLLYSANHFTINPTTNELELLLDGESGAFIAGDNIAITPGAAPSAAPTVTMVAGPGITLGPHRWAYSWRSVLADGTEITTGLSPSASGTSVAPYESATIEGPARPDASINGIYIWRTDTTDRTTFKLVDTITSGLDSAWSYTDATSDTSLGDVHEPTQTRVAVTPIVVLTGDPANAAHTPAGTLSLGPWAKKAPVDGYTYDGLQAGASLLFALDENHKADAIAWYFRLADGTFPPDGSAGLLTADYDHPPADSGWPASLNLWLNGYGEFDGGVQTMASNADPDDTLFSDPLDGYIYVRQDSEHEGLWFRADNDWWRTAKITYFTTVDASAETRPHALGDLGAGTDGSMWRCSAGGTPGTWISIGGGGTGAGFAWESSFTRAAVGSSFPYGNPDIKAITAYDDAENGRTAYALGVKPRGGTPDAWFNGEDGAVNMDTGDGYYPIFGIIPIEKSYGLPGLDGEPFGGYDGPFADLRLDGNIHMSASILTGIYAQGTFGPDRGQDNTNYNPVYMFGGSVTLGVGATHDVSGYTSFHEVYGDIEFFGSVTLDGGTW
jgi:hypothetical protein